MHNLLIEPRVSIDDVLIKTRVKGMDLVPSNIDLSAAEIQLVNEVGREQSLARALHPVLDRYDYVLIDCQPSLGLLTVNGLACADGVIIPTECEYFSLRGLALLTDTVDEGARPAQPEAGHQRHPHHPLRPAHGERPRGDGPGARAVRRSGVRHRHHPDRALPRDQRRRRAHHHVGAEIRLAPRHIGRWRVRSSTGSARELAEHRRSHRRAGFQVRLSNFEGPFDLLLQLIFAHRLDVTEVALHQVTDDFIAYTKDIGRQLELDETTAFLVIAATLLDLKAARLLPAGEVHDEEDLALLEVRDLLFARLLQYRAFKHVAEMFAELEAAALRSYPRAVALEDQFADAVARGHAGCGRRELRPDRGVGVHPAAGADRRHWTTCTSRACRCPSRRGGC